MKKLLALALVAMMATVAVAQPGNSEENMMGMFFSETDFTDENTNFDPVGAPFNGYVVLLNTTVETVGGYELGIAVSDPTVFVLAVTGPNGWTNFGDNLNHLVGYQVPLPAGDVGTVLATVNMLYSGTDLVTFAFGPSEPSSIPGYPVIADGANPDDLYACPLTNEDAGYVATLNGDGVTATETSSWTNVKSLF
ncbi:hypothetical protein GF314_02925 [bacterium]|nr:hypothetical protein [bacterium]